MSAEESRTMVMAPGDDGRRAGAEPCPLCRKTMTPLLRDDPQDLLESWPDVIAALRQGLQ